MIAKDLSGLRRPKVKCPACKAGQHDECWQIDANFGAVDALDFVDMGCRCDEEECAI